jgi:hypothetical protein
MENIQNFKSLLLSEIKEFSENQLIDLNNTFAYEIQNNNDNVIWENDSFTLSELFQDEDPFYIISRAIYGDYRPLDNYFILDGYGNLQSFNVVDFNALCENPEYMLNDILDNWQYFEHLFSTELNDIYQEIEF